MKRWIWYGAALLLVLAVGAEGFAGRDVGAFQPVQTLLVTRGDGRIRVETDTGEWGEGKTLREAFENMENTAAAEMFLDTAEYLLIGMDCEDLLGELMDRLRPSCSVCGAVGKVDPAQAGLYLRAHPPMRTLMEYRAGLREIPVLIGDEGRVELVS